MRGFFHSGGRVSGAALLVLFLCLFQSPTRLQGPTPRDLYREQVLPPNGPSRHDPGKAPRTRLPPSQQRPPLGGQEAAAVLETVLAGDDGDRDGVDDGQDNCPFTPNPLQTDGNDDGLGDACSFLPATSCGNSLLNISGTGTALGLADDGSVKAKEQLPDHGPTSRRADPGFEAVRTVGRNAGDLGWRVWPHTHA